MRTFGEVRVIVCKQGAFTLKTKAIVVADWPKWEEWGWTILAIDPEDEIAYLYALDQGCQPLPSMT